MDTTTDNASPRGARRALLPKTLLSALALGLTLGLGACSSSNNNDSGGGGTAPPSLNSLSGTVRASATEGGTAGGPLAGVTIRAGNASSVTNANGQFILTSLGVLATGSLVVELDGTTAGVAGQFPLLDIVIDLSAGATEAFLPQVITLPDLTNAASSTQAVMTDMSGAVTAPISVTGTEADMILEGDTGTIITVGGMATAQMVNLNMSPVPAAQVPMPLPGQRIGSGFVTIQPGNATFDPPPAGGTAGLDVVLPNDMGLPVGAMVDILSFDHDAGAWVNRSLETGNQGVVIDLGGGETAIDADGVITEGGWHTGSIDVDPDCATTVTGRVVDAKGAPIANASIALFTGQFASTGADGRFSIPLVPAYDIAALAGDPSMCIGVDLCYEAVLSPNNGSLTSGKLVFGAGGVMTGGTTDLGDISFTLPTTGNLAGIVNGTVSPTEPVMIAGPTNTSVVPQSNGGFFVTGLEQGAYTASYLFTGRTNPTVVPFTITAGQTTTITIQAPMGGGEGDITVNVFLGDDDSPGGAFKPLPGAAVTLRGTDSASMNGLVGTTDASGAVTFMNVDGPFDATAQIDLLVAGVQTIRFAGSVLNIDPVGSNIGVPIFFSDAPQSVTDATLMGNLANAPMLMGNEMLMIRMLDDEFGFFEAPIDAQGDYTLNVPSDVMLDAIIYHADSVAQGSVQPIATLDMLGLGPVASGQTLTQDFDWNGGRRVDWDQSVMFDIAGADAAATNAEVTVGISMGNLFFDFDVYDGAIGPFTANLPDATDANLSGYDLVVEADVNNLTNSVDQSCNAVLATTPATYTFDLLTRPTLIAPFDGAMYTVSEISNLDAIWSLGAAGTLTQGVEIFRIAGFSKTKGGITFVWQMFLPVGSTTFRMPPTVLPMFEAGQFDNANISKTRFDGFTFDFDTFFNENVDANLEAIEAALNAACEAGNSVNFMVTP